MSNYYGQAKHPKTGLWETATFHDNFFGKNEYGVQFPDGNVYRVEDVEIKTKGLPLEVFSVASRQIENNAKEERKPEVQYPDEDRIDEFCPKRLERLKKEAQEAYRILAQNMKELSDFEKKLETFSLSIHANTKVYVRKLSAIDNELNKTRFNYVVNQEKHGKEND